LVGGAWYKTNVHFEVESDFGKMAVVVPAGHHRTIDEAIDHAKGKLSTWAEHLRKAAIRT
jgi:hypothetical protein